MSSSASAPPPSTMPSLGSVPPAVIFTVIYGILLPVIAWRFISAKPKPSMSCIIQLSVFSAIRVAAYAIKSYLVAETPADKTLYIVDGVLLGSGSILLFHLLYDLLIDWMQLSTEAQGESSPIAQSKTFRMVKERRFKFLIKAAMGVITYFAVSGAIKVGNSPSPTSDTYASGQKDIRIGIYIYLGLIVANLALALIVYQKATIFGKDGDRPPRKNLLVVAAGLTAMAVMLIYKAFAANPSVAPDLARHEAYFYILGATMELLVVLILVSPVGLSALQQNSTQRASLVIGVNPHSPYHHHQASAAVPAVGETPYQYAEHRV